MLLQPFPRAGVQGSGLSSSPYGRRGWHVAGKKRKQPSTASRCPARAEGGRGEILPNFLKGGWGWGE